MKTQIGIVAALFRHPVKSMLGEQLAELEITERGAIGDRAYALREIATGQIVSAKKFAAMFSFRASWDSQSVVIRLPDGRLIHADDADASEVISGALGRKVKI